MILGRETELQYLQNYYDKEGSQIVIVYGQKHIGKTTLLKEFMKDKDFAYYHAKSLSEREQLYEWGEELASFGMNNKKYPSYADIFQLIIHKKSHKKLIVIDEFQHIVKNSKNFMPELIKTLHNQWNNQPIMVVLMSSSIGWVENSMIGKIGEAAYEISGFLKVKELTFRDMQSYFPKLSVKDCIALYAITGGVPGLWTYLDNESNVKTNICENILRKGCYLSEEGSRYVSEELRETGVYYAILSALASGKSKLNDLYAHTQFSRAKISVYMKNLMELEIVDKVFSYDTSGRENTQKGLYAINNCFVHFWFKYIYSNLSMWTLMDEETFYQKYIEPDFAHYTAQHASDVFAEYMEEQNYAKNLPFTYEKSGKWIGKAGTIDFIAQDNAANTIVGLCSFENENLLYADYEWLNFCLKKARVSADYIYLFSTGGFDDKVKTEAEKNTHIILIGLEQLKIKAL